MVPMPAIFTGEAKIVVFCCFRPRFNFSLGEACNGSTEEITEDKLPVRDMLEKDGCDIASKYNENKRVAAEKLHAILERIEKNLYAHCMLRNHFGF